MTCTASRFLAVVCTAALCAGIGNQAAADLILYEGFGDYSAGNLKDQNVGANTIGLNKSTAWEVNNDIEWLWASTGLTIGSGATTLQTSPGAVIKQSGSSVLGAKLDLDEYVGTLYASYLYSMDLSQATGVPNGVVFTVIGEGTENNTNRRFRQMARQGSTGASPVGVSYINGATAGTGQVNDDGMTFMILSRFTRVGQTVDAETPGVATLWALSSEQFDHFKSTDFAGIDAATVGAASSQVTGMATHTYGPDPADLRALDSTWYLQLGSALARSIFITWDEVRLGDSFDAVTPVVGGGTLLGDFNNDGKVDAADYVVWRKTDGSNQAGYDEWRSHFGMTSTGAAATAEVAAIPEPSALALLVLGCVGAAWGRRCGGYVSCQ